MKILLILRTRKENGRDHKKYVYIHFTEYHRVCPLVGIVTLPVPTPLSPTSVPLPPEPMGKGAHSPAGEGLGESQFRRLEKSLALCLLIGRDQYECSLYVCLSAVGILGAEEQLCTFANVKKVCFAFVHDILTTATPLK